ncbi:MAG: TolC family protein [Armatimonadota bacterium]
MTGRTGIHRIVQCRHPMAALFACLILTAPVAAQAPESIDASDEIQLPAWITVTEDGEIVLTPESAAWWAIDRNTRLRIERQQIDEAEGQLQQAEAADDLTVSASARAMRMGPVTTVQLPAEEGEEPQSVEVTPDQQYAATLSANKPLYTGGRTGLGEKIAQEGVDAAQIGTDVASLSVAQGARSAGYGVLRAQQLAGIAAAQVTALAEHVRNAEAMEEAGVVPHFDVVQARTELARAQEDLITAQTGIEQVKAQLRQVLALPQETPLEVEDAIPPEMPPGDLPELIDVAQLRRPEVAAAMNGLRTAELNRKLAARELEPTIALTGQYSRQTSSGFGGDEYSWQIGVVAEKPILDGGRKQGMIQSAEARVEQAELQVEITQEQVALEVVQAWLSVQEARERITTAQQGLVEARERRRMAQLRYREGLAAGIEVIDADTALAAAEASLVNAEYDRQLAVTQLRTAMGIMDGPRQEGETQ